MTRLDFKMMFGEIGAILGIFIGGADGLIKALIIFAVVDYITGVAAAAIEHKLNSEIGFKGITKKLLLFCIVGVAHVLDLYVLGTGAVCRSAVVLFYIANEGLSIIENVARCGLPIPDKLRIILEQLKKEGNNGPAQENTRDIKGDTPGRTKP